MNKWHKKDVLFKQKIILFIPKKKGVDDILGCLIAGNFSDPMIFSSRMDF